MNQLLYFLLLSLFFTCLVITTANGENIGLSFNREFLLLNVFNSSNANTIPGGFLESAGSAFSLAVSPLPYEPSTDFYESPVNVNAYTAETSIILAANTWVTGGKKNVTDRIASLENMFAKFGMVRNASLISDLNRASYDSFGAQPRVLSQLSVCQQGINPSSNICRKNLTASILTPKNPGSYLTSALCFSLNLSCSLVKLVSVSTAVVNNSRYFSSNYLILSQDRDYILATLLNLASHASVLSNQNITYIYVLGTMVYYKGDMPQLTYPGTISACTSHYWYLIFFILLFPLIVIILHRSWDSGRKSGIRSIKKTEMDIRAGAYVTNTWNQYPPPYSTAGNNPQQFYHVQQEQNQDYYNYPVYTPHPEGAFDPNQIYGQ